MIYYAGIDEAGYGPIFGPLVITRSVFSLEREQAGSNPPSLWSALNYAVCRKANDKKRRIAVSDSKLLYSPAIGLRNLERAALSFLHAADRKPKNLDDLISLMAFDEYSSPPGEPWYHHPSGGPAIPVESDPTDIERCARKLITSSSRKGIKLEDASAVLIFEKRFNHIVAANGSKLACAWQFVGDHLKAIWDAYGKDHLYVALDRQSGRKDYSDGLKSIWPEAGIDLIESTPQLSSYRISDEERAMDLHIRVNCEKYHLPTALSSMISKYLRELLIMRFRAFWQEIAPDINPTFGYVPDGRRFLGEIEPLIVRLGIERDSLVRRY
jgi:hypothetical protein